MFGRIQVLRVLNEIDNQLDYCKKRNELCYFCKLFDEDYKICELIKTKENLEFILYLFDKELV